MHTERFRSPRSIKTRTYFYFSILVIFLLIIVSVLLWNYFDNGWRTRAYSEKESIIESISDHVDSNIKFMQEISVEVIFNTYISDALKNISEINDPKAEAVKLLKNSATIEDHLFLIAQPFSSIYRISLFNQQGLFCSSKVPQMSKRTIEEIANDYALYDSVLEREGRIFLQGTHPDIWNDRSKDPVFTLARSIVRNGKTECVLEIQERFDILRKCCETFERDMAEIIILDQMGSVAYPDGELSEDAKRCVDWYCAEEQPGTKTQELSMPDGEQDYVVSSKRSDYSGWSVLYMMSEKAFNQSNVSIRNNMLLTMLAFLIVFLGVSYAISELIYKPVHQLCDSVRNIDYVNLEMPTPAGVRERRMDIELTELYNAFDEMMLRMKMSVDQKIDAQMQSQRNYFKAVQAQMNPHFLYNTIGIISIMAKRMDDSSIPSACQRLNEMLQYVANFDNDVASVEQEFNNIECYLELMKLRYEHRLDYRISCENDDVLQNTLPKFSLQPLVENSIRHGLENNHPAVCVEVTAWQNDQGMRVIISDNGVGFDEQKLADLQRTIAHVKEKGSANGERPYFEETRSGVINVCMRTVLMFRENAIFNIANKPEGGAEIEIGFSRRTSGDLGGIEDVQGDAH